jgi:hypothetical protein
MIAPDGSGGKSPDATKSATESAERRRRDAAEFHLQNRHKSASATIATAGITASLAES